MKALRIALTVAGLLGALPAFAAPKHILVSDNLLADSEPWDVKRNDKWVGMNHWQFGEFRVVASKSGWITGGADTNFWRTKSVRHREHKFSFVMTNQSADSAVVNASRQVVSRSNPGLDVGHGTHVGGTGQTVETEDFVASIAVGRDTTEIWTLVFGETEVTEMGWDRDDLASHTSMLVHEDRRISLVPVFSKDLSKKPSFGAMLAMGVHPPAMGYEFIEGGRSLGAVEYFSSSVSGLYKNTVWMGRGVDPQLRLVLAAAMASTLSLKCEEQPQDPAEE
jgi:hypothetical protein